jgi:hypothetical protein
MLVDERFGCGEPREQLIVNGTRQQGGSREQEYGGEDNDAAMEGSYTPASSDRREG